MFYVLKSCKVTAIGAHSPRRAVRVYVVIMSRLTFIKFDDDKRFMILVYVLYSLWLTCDSSEIMYVGTVKTIDNGF